MVTDHLIINPARDFVAIQKNEQPVQDAEHRELLQRIGSVRWDDLHLIKSVALSNSFRQSAVLLGCSVNTVRAHVTRLETTLGTTLFKRSRHGIALSEDGLAILEVAIEMQSFSTQLQHGAGNNVVVKAGEMRICCSEGIGAYWLTPRIGALHACLPEHVIVMNNESDQSVIHLPHYDLRIGFSKPTDPDVIVKKLATVHQILFASDIYLEQHGMPTSIDDLRHHRLVLQDAVGVNSDAISLFFGQEAARRLIAAKFNTGNALLRAVLGGVGIGALPTYVGTISRRLVPIPLPVSLKFELWLSFERSGATSRPVREAINWVEHSFDPARYPWFADEFVHPDAFLDRLAEEHRAYQLM
jgi:DNA-binding transcriptional LysR family regulator